MSYTRWESFNEAHVAALGTSFREASPFPHLVLHDFLTRTEKEVLPFFPAPTWEGWRSFSDSYQAGKLYCQDISAIPEPLGQIIHDLSSPAFLQFLETVTGIESLIPDPYLEGGGLHCSGAGGILTPHTDFHIYERLNLYRRINVLVYLNPTWEEAWGGSLELWRKGDDRPTKEVAPSWGKCVIFLTDDRSVHGFSKPVTADAGVRRSLALYYYTSSEAERYSGDTTTYWQQHGAQPRRRLARLHLYRGLMKASRSLAILAHRANPNIAKHE